MNLVLLEPSEVTGATVTLRGPRARHVRDVLKVEPGAAIRVGIEGRCEAWLALLAARGYVVFEINPKQADRFRDRFFAAGAKEVGSLTVCGPSGCHAITAKAPLRGFMDGGYESPAPRRGGPYFDVKVRMRHDGEDAGGQDGAGLAAHVCSLLFES